MGEDGRDRVKVDSLPRDDKAGPQETGQVRGSRKPERVRTLRVRSGAKSAKSRFSRVREACQEPSPARAGDGTTKGERMKGKPRRVEKPWGYELIWAESDAYVGKILHIDAGEALSLQYHEVKEETLYLLSGEMKFYAAPLGSELEEIELVAGDSFHVRPNTVHRMVAVTEVTLLEASTPHLDDVVRLEDRYGRVPERARTEGRGS